MGKQTKQKGSHFGGEWTVQKLHIIEKYVEVYLKALKNQKFKKIYVDGFAGSGKTALKSKSYSNMETIGDSSVNEGSVVVEGSALLSLKYDFDEYYFLELDPVRIAELRRNVEENYPEKLDKVHFIEGDSNRKLLEVASQITVYSRCLMFLDPYALELKWSTLERISQCGVVDLWYLFPLSLLRLLEKKRDIGEANKKKITSILGTDEWFDKLFVESGQLDIFGETHYERKEYGEVLAYVKERFKTIFPFVSPESKILKNEAKNSPMFMLCFMMTNESENAQRLASKLVKAIIKSAEKL